jgi:hypothetical protein
MFLFATLSVYSQKSVNRLFDEYVGAKDASKVRIGKAAMKISSLFTDTYGAEVIEVISLDEAADDVKQRFANAVKALKDADYETLVTSNADGNSIKIMLRIEKDVIRELVVLSAGKDAALIRIKGKIQKSDIAKIINKGYAK